MPQAFMLGIGNAALAIGFYKMLEGNNPQIWSWPLKIGNMLIGIAIISFAYAN